MAKANLLPSLGEGFRLIVRQPLSVLVWGLISFAAALVPALIYWALLGPEMVTFYAKVGEVSSAGKGEMPMPPGMSAGAYLVQLLQWVLMVVSGALVYAGVYRAVLRPEEGGIGHVRFSMDEVNVGVVLVVMFVLSIVVSILAMLVIFIPAFIGIAFAAAAGGGVGAALLVPLAMIAIVVLLVLLYSRFGMALPMTFAEKRIRIFEAWAFTKGYAGQLLGMALIQLAFILVLYFAVVLTVVAAMAGVMTDFGSGLDSTEIEALFRDPDAVLQRFLPFIVAGGGMYLVASFLLQPILLAPWAKAYQRIAADNLASRAEIFTEGQ